MPQLSSTQAGPPDLALIDRARRALEQARDVPELADLRDRAMAMERYPARREGAAEAARHGAGLGVNAAPAPN